MSHSNTLFNEMLHLIPRHIFQKLETRHKTGRSSRKFGFKEQFIVMAFIMFAASRSLRDAIASFSAQGSRLYHWGLSKVCRSTVSDANRERPWKFFEDLYLEICNLCIQRAPNHKFRFMNKIFSLDSTVVTLSAKIFSWAAYRSSKHGIKIHTILDHSGYIPTFITITEAKLHDSKILKDLNIPKGSFLIFDRAYSAMKWFSQLCKSEIFFVTRKKIDMNLKIIERIKIDASSGVTSDHIVEMNNGKEQITLRKVGFTNLETGKHYDFLTNNFTLEAKEIADLYKDRWSIELFFKEIKQFLKIKKFVGTNENAVRIQIYTAMIIYLLIALQKFISKINQSVGQIFQIIQLNLVGFRSLYELLKLKRESTSSQYTLQLIQG